MELEFTSNLLQYLKPVFCDNRCREESTDAIIPDSSPDVERIITVNATAVMRSKECRSGSVSVSGGIRCTVLYMAEQEQQPRCLEMYLPYSIRADESSFTEDSMVMFSPWIRGADAKVVNSRKLNVCVDLCYSLRVYEKQQEQLPVLSSCPESLQTLNAVYPVLLPMEIAERSFRLTEELQIPQSRPLKGQVLNFEPRLELTEKRLAGNKAVFKGLVHASVIYESGDNKLCSIQAELPFSQFCELREVYDEETPEILLTVTGSELERTSRQDGDGLLFTVHILAQSVVSARKELSIVSDAYSVEGELVPTWKELEIQSCLDRQNYTRTLRESWQGSVDEIIGVSACLEEPFAQRTDNAAELVANVNMKVLYREAGGALQECCIRTALREQLAASPEVQFDLCAAVIGEPTVLPTAGGMELRCTVHLSVATQVNGKYRTLCGGAIRDMEVGSGRPAVIVRRTRSGERLWDIAKANGTTVERIRMANRMDAEETECGILLIPT